MGEVKFRVCPVTTFKVYKNTESLIQANAVLAVLSLLVGGISAFIVVLTRWMGLFSPNLFYLALSLHGWNMLIFWIIFFEVAVLYFVGSVMLNTELPYPGWGWAAFILMVLGEIIVDLSQIINPMDNSLMFTSYVPLQGTLEYYVGANLFLFGALIALIVFFATLVKAKLEGNYGKSLPLVVLGGFVAAVLAFTTVVPGIVYWFPALLWKAKVIGYLDPINMKITFWGYGHASQQINLAAMIAVWYLLAFLTVGGTTPSEKVSRFAFLLYIIAIQLGSAHHLETETALSVIWKWINTGYLVHIAILGSMIHGFAVPGAIERGQRLRGYNNGLFEWLRKGPWKNPAFSSLILSIVFFGFLGGTSGVIGGTEQLNLLWHNTMAMAGHFHAVVVTGTTLAFMGLTWYVLPLIFRREIVGKKLASIQPWLYGIGMAILIWSFIQLGIRFNLPRRQPDIFNFGGSPFAFQYDPMVYVFLFLAGIGGLLAILGGAIYVILTVSTVFFGERLGDEELRRRYRLPIGEVRTNGGIELKTSLKGTFVLTIIFWLWFLGLYLLNWYLLSGTWPLGG